MAKGTLSVACIQLTSTPDRAANTKQSVDLIRQAAGEGIAMASLPEYADLMVDKTSKRLIGAQAEEESDALRTYRDLAAELGIWIHVGSLGVKISDDRIANRSFLIDGKGEVVARYDKKYLFDVNLPDGQIFKESSCVVPGPEGQFIIADTPWGRMGLSICFDLRFPGHFQGLTKRGAEILLVPAAYSIPTGRESWHVFLRARAMENMCFIIAAAQCGTHEGTRQTFGHSAIVGPDGRIIAEAGEEPGFITATLDLDEIEKRRACFPTLLKECRV